MRISGVDAEMVPTVCFSWQIVTAAQVISPLRQYRGYRFGWLAMRVVTGLCIIGFAVLAAGCDGVRSSTSSAAGAKEGASGASGGNSSSASSSTSNSAGSAASVPVWEGSSAWVRERFFEKTPRFPFSFAFQGVRYGGTTLASWIVTQRRTPLGSTGTQWTFVLLDPTKTLRVSCDLKNYTIGGLAEWVLSFENIGPTISAPITDVRVFDDQVVSAVPGPVRLHYSLGAEENNASGTFSYSDFQPTAKMIRSGENFALEPSNGRSSSGIMPYFNLEAPGAMGSILAVGWSGQWQTQFEHTSDLATLKTCFVRPCGVILPQNISRSLSGHSYLPLRVEWRRSKL
jgi:hypothetical protein